ncbi:N-acetylmuramoyl-L-alanine amidase [Peribacillus sp. SCS-37]|uniref:N-acetylmuramoyl-L-alanine amidase n=1 Tax=Paraperibacillus esterisolvens TaxID=3115296 RepID=UPI00390698AC
MSIIKRIFSIIIISFIVFANLLFVNLSQGSAAGFQEAKVNATILNVRTLPTTKSTILWKLTKGQQVKITDSKTGWAKITYPNKESGWVSTDFLTPVNTAAPRAVSAKPKTFYVTASSLNLRKSANATSDFIASMPKNAKVSELSRSGSWSKVTYGSKTGWAANKYLTTKAPAAAKPSTTVKPKTYYVSASSLNIRKSASANSASLGTISKGGKVTEVSKSGTWSKIIYGSKTGWVSNKYLTSKAPAAPKPPAVPLPPAQTLKKVKITSNDVNLRSGPGTNYKVVDTVDSGATFTKVGESNGWVKIQLSDKSTAWVAGWLVTYNVSGSSGIKGKTIVLDAGHGGSDPGAVGYSPSLKKYINEKDLTLMMVQKTAALLKSAGANVILTRSSNTFNSLQSRVDVAEKYKADAFVSVHYNSSTASSANGIETFYYSNAKDKKLADAIHKEMVEASKLRNRGVKSQSLHVIRENSRPAVLLELGFISNKAELDYIMTDGFQKALAKAIYDGLYNYFQ